MLETIGNTPIIKINYEYKGKNKYIYTKLEYYNLTGSIKDRVAYYIINEAKKRDIKA
jgi:cysteine synthase A